MWPKYKFSYALKNISNFYFNKIFRNEISQTHLNKNFVVVSSGRAAIVNILKCFQFDRHSKIAVGPFTNQCIYNSAGFVCSPVLSNINVNFDAQLIYHQFGYNMKSDLSIFTIEDSVDSYIFAEEYLFQNNGRFEILSLPKISNFCFGAMIFCKNTEDFNKLSNVINQQQKGFQFNLNLFLMMLNANHFDFRKKINLYEKKLPLNIAEFITFLINKNLKFEQKINNKIEAIQNFIDYKPRIQKRRFPSSVPLKVDKKFSSQLIKDFPFLYVRTINQSFDFLKWDLVEKIFLPLHQDINIKEIQRLSNSLKKI